jgi:uncharacterized phiE125 gp8 family phage protein
MTYYQSWSRHAYSVVVDPPAEEPLTLDEAKLRAGLDWPAADPRDDLMKAFIAAARAKVEQDTGLALLTQTQDLFYDGSPLYGQPLLLVVGQCRPLQYLVSVAPMDPTVTPLGGAIPGATPRTVPPPPSPPVAWPELVAGTAVVLRLVAGWPDVATLRATVPLLVQAVGLLCAHYATLGRDLASIDTVTEVPQGYCDLIGPYIPAMAP